MPRWTAEGLPPDPLERAAAIQDRASELGFDWPEAAPVWDKIAEELQELREAIAGGQEAQIRHEWGDVLFALINLARFLPIEPQQALEEVNQRFDSRLQGVQALLDAAGLDWDACSLDQLEELWQKAKRTSHQILD